MSLDSLLCDFPSWLIKNCLVSCVHGEERHKDEWETGSALKRCASLNWGQDVSRNRRVCKELLGDYYLLTERSKTLEIRNLDRGQQRGRTILFPAEGSCVFSVPTVLIMCLSFPPCGTSLPDFSWVVLIFSVTAVFPDLTYSACATQAKHTTTHTIWSLTSLLEVKQRQFSPPE